MVGLAFDIGYLEFMQRRAQTAADAAALAGALGLPYGTATASAKAGSKLNGFTDGANNVTVVVNNPPKHGPNASNTNYVEAIVSQKEPVFFLRMAGIGPSTTVSARAVATNTQGDCIFALNPTMSGALTFEPGSLNDIYAPKCAVIVDSNSGSAVSGFFTLTFVTASQISVVGNVSCFICIFTPNPVTSATALSDPLAYLPAPTVAGCAGTAYPITPASGNVTVPPGCWNVNITATGAQTITFNPGEYSAITVNPSVGPKLIFNPGLYIIQGSGGLSLNGFGVTIQGTGVTFYMGPSAGSLAVYGVANFINLVAPTTGTYAGILFFQDRSNSNAACVGGCGASLGAFLQFMQIQGALYFPDAGLTFDGCCQTTISSPACTPPYCTAYEIVVADHMSFAWDYFGDDYSSLPGGSPIKRTQLTE